MAGRKQRENADYFPHDADASSDEKIVYLESIFGLQGYAIYFKFIEILTRSANFEIEYNDIKKSVYAKKIGISAPEIDQFVAECVRKEIKAFVIKDGLLFSPGLKKRLEPLVDKREKMRIRYEEIKQTNSETNNSETEISNSVAEITQSKVKKSKEKNRIEKYIIVESEIPDSLLSINGFLDSWKEWVEYRKEIKKPITSRSAKMQFKQLESFIDPVGAIENSIANQYQGLFEKRGNNGKSSGISSAEDFAREAKERFDRIATRKQNFKS